MTKNNKTRKMGPKFRARPTALDLRFIGVPGNPDSVEIHVESTPRGLRSHPIVIGKSALRAMRKSLIDGIEAYTRDKTFGKLKALAELGYETFNILSSTHGPIHRERWRKLFEAPNDVRHSVIRVKFDGDFSFPVGLLCSSKPTTDQYKELVNKFIGARSVVINSLGMIHDREDDRNHVSVKRPCWVAHAIDVDVPGAGKESKFLGALEGLRTSRCKSKAELVEAWNSRKTGIIHFTSHHRFDVDSGQYVLTLSGGEKFGALSDRVQINRANDGLPFLFLNGCNTGQVLAGFPDTFASSLSPAFSSGILTTLHSVGGVDAAQFARTYYQKWLATDFAIDALAQTKHEYVFNRRDFSAITYEFWAMPEVLTLFEWSDDEEEIS
ncbi:CHAT domain-containing protein [Hydrogenophaga sp. PAMC20947]|uniref:CHAT domain-containing protein n=1 Tax=Hydrogenophaga sp. PAMC20947 TaxID=2565558 RepID=UPI001446DA03|nr:CHAT domain-containing protein [Hydrogenophaga sp. PAMC20947]